MRTLVTIMIAILAACSHAPPPASPADARNQLARAREVSLQRIHDYGIAGAYPVDAYGRPASMFRDPSGRLCAMASLIDASGRHDLVDQVARTDNHLRLADVKDGPLMDWMLTSGLTQEEIALVQGALDVNYPHLQLPIEIGPVLAHHILGGRAEVARRIAAAERTLRSTTAVSLALAAQRLQRDHAAAGHRDAVAALPPR